MGSVSGNRAGFPWVAGRDADHTRSAMARALFVLFASGTVLALIALPFAGYMAAEDKLGVLVVCGVAVVVCAVLHLGGRLPPWAFHAILALGTLLITAGVYLTRESPGSVQMLYIWVALFVGYFLARAQALAHVAFVAAIYAAVLPTTANSESHAGRWLLVVGTLVGTTLLVSELKRRLDRRIEASERSERELEQSLSLLRSTLESTADGILVVDRAGNIVTFNGKFQQMWRIPDQVVESREDDRALAFVLDQLADPEQFRTKVRELYDRPDAESYDVLQFKDGRVFERYSQPQWASDGSVIGRVWSFRNVTDRERIQSQLRHLADHDVLTGLLNRRRFEEELSRQVAYGARYGTSAVVLVLDLDDFKEVNDTLGHRTGDAVISSVAYLVRDSLREIDILARLGGDEFAVLLPATDGEGAERVAVRLLDAVRDHGVMAGGQRVRVTTSIGIALVDGASASAEELLARADIAMYEAKESGRDRLCFYDPTAERLAHMQAKRTWSDRIAKALENDLFTLYVQPILELESGDVSQYELLLRLNGEDGELVPPRGFLPSAERVGMIHEIDAWVMRRAIHLIDEHRRAGSDLRLEVNLSGRTIGNGDFLGVIEDELDATEVDPASLIFEVTETAAISNMDEARDFSSALRRIGCRFALDDFGAGFGSFHYVKYLPLDYLKIDGDFIADLTRNPSDQAVVQAIVELSSRLGKETIAEFVGDDETLELLHAYGVDYAQGYHVGRPKPASEILATGRIGVAG